MIDHINQTRARHIVTLEDPIEYLHPDKRSIVNQREVGSDTESFGRAMRRVLRQDPDVILIGEMRDEETVRTALSAAETGHLVLSTVHTLDATETINRIIDFFPPHLQQQARVMLASTLKGAIAQRLVPDMTGEGRVPASEVLVVTGRVQDLILNPEETGKITEVIAEGEYYGMRTFDQSLLGYVMEGRISRGGGARLRLQPARLQADAGRRRPARERHRAARAEASRWRREGEAERTTRSAQVGLVARSRLVAGVFMLLSKSGGGEEAKKRADRSDGLRSPAPSRPDRDRRDARRSGRRRGRRADRSAAAGSLRAPPASVPAPPPPQAGHRRLRRRQDRRPAGRPRRRHRRRARRRRRREPVRLPGRRPLRRPGQADLPLRGDHPRRRRQPGAGAGRDAARSGSATAMPQATVDYGFQTPESVVQAVRDASYEGPEATYHPN